MATRKQLVKTNQKPQQLNDLLKSIFTNELDFDDYRDCLIVDTKEEIKIKIIELDDFKFFIVDFKNQEFTLPEFMLFGNPDKLNFNLLAPQQKLDAIKQLDDNIELKDELLTYTQS